MDIDTFKKWLPIYKESAAILSNVPTDVAREMLKLCKESEVDCELHPEGPGVWLVEIRGGNTKL